MQDEATGSRGVFLLKGEDYEPVYPAGFLRLAGRARRNPPAVGALIGDEPRAASAPRCAGAGMRNRAETVSSAARQ